MIPDFVRGRCFTIFRKCMIFLRMPISSCLCQKGAKDEIMMMM